MPWAPFPRSINGMTHSQDQCVKNVLTLFCSCNCVRTIFQRLHIIFGGILVVMPQSQMVYDVCATPLRRIFPQFLAMIVQFYRACNCDNCCCCGDCRPSSAELNSFWKLQALQGCGMGRWRLACMVPAWCWHLELSVLYLQDCSGHHGAIKCCKIARCMHGCCQHREGLAR
jgi:hypothetical protein